MPMTRAPARVPPLAVPDSAVLRGRVINATIDHGRIQSFTADGDR